MINPVKPKAKDNHFSSFALGVAVGVGAVLLFGTEEGKKITSKLFDSLPEKIKNLTDQQDSSLREEFVIANHEVLKQSPPDSILLDPESTPHSYTYNEPPPPPAPHVIPTPPSLRVS